MPEQYCILVEMKTADGFVEYCRYFLGDKRDRAYEIFNLLAGERILPKDYALRMDFAELNAGNARALDTLYCTLNQLLENSAIISREVFKQLNIG